MTGEQSEGREINSLEVNVAVSGSDDGLLIVNHGAADKESTISR